VGFPRAALAAIIAMTGAIAADSIRDIDFRNLEHPWDSPGAVPSGWVWLARAPAASLRLVDGSWADPNGRGWPWVSLRTTTYGDLTGDGHDEAAIDLLYSTGGTANWHYLYVYTLTDGAPKLMARLRSGSRADGGLIRVAIENGLLVLDFADTKKRTADCCSEGEVRVRYRWSGGRFVEARAALLLPQGRHRIDARRVARRNDARAQDDHRQ
jgi:hypothetical protein